MLIHIFNPVSGRRAKIDARILSKVLHLACFQGWQPERMDAPALPASWDTQIVMPHVAPYLSGTVSDNDAAGLLAALKVVLASEGSGLASDVYVAVLGLKVIAEGGGFELQAEEAESGEDGFQWELAAGQEGGRIPHSQSASQLVESRTDRPK